MAPDFFSRQKNARRRTWYLVLLFLLAVGALIVALYFAFAGLLSPFVPIDLETGQRAIWWHRPQLFATVSIATVFTVALGMWFRISQLAEGGAAVAELLGGRLVLPNAANDDERRLLNVVEEMSIAAGIAVPQVYVLDREEGINAFAAGYTTGDAAVAVTRGCLQQLNRQELEGVIAHEFSHILNGDMRLNIRLMGLLHGILCVAVGGRIVLDHTGNAGRGAAAVLAVGTVLLVLGYIGVFFGTIIRAAVSRQREFLADASAVQFTRNPAGLGDALKKIAGYAGGTTMRNVHTPEASHMLFANGVRDVLSNLFATHPPLARRIAALDPWFRTFPAASPGTRADTAKTGAAIPVRRRTTVDAVLASTGMLTEHQIAHARQLISTLPLAITVAVRDPFSARAVILAMLLSHDHEVLGRQFDYLKSACDDATFAEIIQVRGTVRELPPQQRLGTVDLAMPALRRMSPGQYLEFREHMLRLTEQNRIVQLFGFVLERVLRRNLDATFSRVTTPPLRFFGPRRVIGECGTLLSVLAHAGHESEVEAKTAYDRAIEVLLAGSRGLAVLPPPITARAECRLGALERALERLGMASLDFKRTILRSMAEAIATDGEIAVAEHELLRAAADTFECPVPPIPLPG